MAEKQIFSLKQVVQSIQRTLEERYNSSYWVKAELHKLNRYPSGHAFPELVQREDAKIVAQLNGSIWKTQLERIEKQFHHVVQEPLKEGITVLMLTKITYHPQFGLSLQILDIDPSYTLGELQREREETLKKLLKEGILHQNQQLALPLLCKRIAVISAKTSKGLSDFYEVLDQNPYGFTFHSTLVEAYVQGDLAVQSIYEALQQIKAQKAQFDVVVIVRGGGAEVGMTCYNQYELCRAICTFPLPILTGIGHSTNQTVAELVAHQHAITPTKLADIFVQQFKAFDERISQLQQKFATAVLHQLVQSKHVLNQRTQQLAHSSRRNLNLHGQQLETLHIKGQFISVQRINNEFTALDAIQTKIDLLDPLLVLKRGYSITTMNGELLSKKKSISNGMRIQTQTENGLFESEIVNAGT
ncbi:MAG: Exodeoxyribonuclease 7 large subunit [Bacteroidota bacterium]